MQPKILEDDKVLNSDCHVRDLVYWREKELRNCARDAGLNPSDFVLKLGTINDRPHEVRPILVHRPTGHWFVLDGTERRFNESIALDADEEFRSWFFPGPIADSQHQDHDTWELQVEEFKHWLARVKEIVDEPKLWADLAQAEMAEEAAWQESDERFSSEERTQIVAALKAVEVRVKELCSQTFAPPEALERIHIKLDQLAKDVNRLNRRQWHNSFMGVLIKIIAEAAIRGALMSDFLAFASVQINGAVGIEVAIRSLPQ